MMRAQAEAEASPRTLRRRRRCCAPAPTASTRSPSRRSRAIQSRAVRASSASSPRPTWTTTRQSRYLQEVIERAGLNDGLRRAGAVPGDTVIVGESEFEFS